MEACTVISLLHKRDQFSIEHGSRWDDPFILGVNRAV